MAVRHQTWRLLFLRNMSTRVRTKRVNHNAFNVMVAGHSRTGKTAFIHTFYETLNVYKLHPVVEGQKTTLPPNDVTEPTPSPSRIECNDAYNSQKVMLRLIDSQGLDIPPGINKATSSNQESLLLQAKVYAKSLCNFIEGQFEKTLKGESLVRRDTNAIDEQVHVLLYFINPDIVLASKGLTDMDVYVLKKLCPRVNVVPLIAKSDLISVRELKSIRAHLKEAFAKHNLALFHFERDEDEEDDLNEISPFCIVSSEQQEDDDSENPAMGVLRDGKNVLGREYVWGIVETENRDHCDFVTLKEAVLGSHFEDLKQNTREILYENWRTYTLETGKNSVIAPKFKFEE